MTLNHILSQTHVNNIIIVQFFAGTDITVAVQEAYHLHNAEKKAVIFTFNGALISIGGTYND